MLLSLNQTMFGQNIFIETTNSLLNNHNNLNEELLHNYKDYLHELYMIQNRNFIGSL